MCGFTDDQEVDCEHDDLEGGCFAGYDKYDCPYAGERDDYLNRKEEEYREGRIERRIEILLGK